MARYALQIGLVLRRGERSLEVRRLLDEGKRVVLEDQETGEPQTMSVGELASAVLHERLIVVREGRSSPQTEGAATTGQPMLVTSLDSLQQKYQDELVFRRGLITLLRRDGMSRGMRRQIAAKLERLRKTQTEAPAGEAPTAGRPFPTASTVMAWWRRLEEGDDSPSTLVNGNAHRKPVRVLGDAVMQTVRTVLRTFYCTSKRPTLVATTREANKQLIQLDPAASVSESTIRRELAQFDQYAVDAARYGKGYAKNKWRYSLSGVNAVRPLQRVEIDHTLIDLVVICDSTGLPLGRPTITVVVDGFSGYILGFFISFWGTGLAATLAALKQAMLPKDLILAAAQATTHAWIAWGLHEVWVVDNALEFHAPQFTMAAMEMGNDMLFCPVRQPWFKPLVERQMLDIKLALPPQGLVRKGLTSEVPVDPRKTACVRFSDLCVCLLKAFVDVFPFEINDRKLARPFDLYADGIAEMPPLELPTDLRSFDLLSCTSKQLTVGNEGVVHQYLRYNSRELQDLRRHTAHTFKTSVKFHPDNLSMVHVQDPRSKAWLPVPSCLPQYTTGLSLLQHRAIRTQKRTDLNARNAEEELMRGKDELAAMWSSAVRSGRLFKGQQQKLLQLGCLTSAQLFPSQIMPEPEPVTVERLFDDNELASTPKQIPTYQSFQLE